MLRSMFSAIGGLKAHQVMMDVTANNIANVNTVGYKSQRVTFSAMLTQTLRGGSAPNPAGPGGVNPEQVGLGVTVGGIQSVLTQGSLQTTGQWSDVAVQGDGYFILSPQRAAATPTSALFTRAGNFTLDSNGDLVTASGDYVLGASVNSAGPPPTFNTDLKAINVPVSASSAAIGADGVVSYTDSTGASHIAGQIGLAKFPNPGGLNRVADNLWTVSPNSGIYDSTNANNSATPTAGVATWGAPSSNGRGALQSGTVEMSNVDLASEFTSMITSQRGFQANAKVITASDEMLQDLVNLKR